MLDIHDCINLLTSAINQHKEQFLRKPFSMTNKISPILVTWVLGNKWFLGNFPKNTFGSPSKNSDEKGESIITVSF